MAIAARCCRNEATCIGAADESEVEPARHELSSMTIDRRSGPLDAVTFCQQWIVLEIDFFSGRSPILSMR